MEKPELTGDNEREVIKSAEAYAKSVGLKMNPDKKVVEMITKGLLKKKEKYGALHCPCRISTGNKEKDDEITCPCVFHRGEIELQGHCKCNYFFA